MKDIILAVDQSTSGTKAVIFDKQGHLVHQSTIAHQQYYPRVGWVEHDPEEIYSNTIEVITQVQAESKIDSNRLAALAITNQRETIVVWERSSGRPIYNAIVWQCRRGTKICAELEKRGYGEFIYERTGLVLSPYFSAAKLRWILDNIPDARKKAEQDQLLFGTIDTWLLWRLTRGYVHATDYSNASRTQLFNPKRLEWDQDILDIFCIPRSMLPEVRFSDEIFGMTHVGLNRELPVAGVMGDSSAALFGQNCFTPGMAKATYGTGSSIMMNVGVAYQSPIEGLVASIAWGVLGEIEYAYEGNVNCSGDTIKWLVDNIGLLPNPQASAEFAQQVTDCGGTYFVPAFAGLGAPYWDSNARATITGMTRGTTKAHLVRAALESIVYQIRDILDLMVDGAEIDLYELRVDGGPTKNDFLMQFQADMLNAPVTRAKVQELSALGAAFAAGLAIGMWRNKEDLAALRQTDRTFASNMAAIDRADLYAGWKAAVRRTIARF